VLAALFLVIPGATGCTAVVTGAVRPPLGVKQILLNGHELTQLVGQSFRADPKFPPDIGSDRLLRHFSRVSPPECAGVVYQLSSTTYDKSEPQRIAEESWWNAGSYLRGHLTVVNVFEAVVALPSAQAATAVFATATGQWRSCDGKTVVNPAGRNAISDVRLANSVLGATVAADIGLNVVMRTARAIGVRANCVVEVSVPFFNDSVRKTAATDVAHAMMNKIRAVSSEC
jgi:hypothetical protein